jgi:hypothetical protein
VHYWRWEGRTVLTGCMQLHLLVFCETLWHSENKERLGEVCAGCCVTECSTWSLVSNNLPCNYEMTVREM